MHTVDISAVQLGSVQRASERVLLGGWLGAVVVVVIIVGSGGGAEAETTAITTRHIGSEEASKRARENEEG